VTANGWDSDAPGETPADNDSPAGSSFNAGDPAQGEAEYAGQPESASQAGYAGQPESASQAASEPGPLPGGLTPGLLVPGMGVRSPALDYMLGTQRRRMRNLAAVAASIVGIVVVVAVVAIAAHSGAKKAGSAQLTAAQIVQQAVRQQNGLHSLSATISEDISGQVTGTVTGAVELQRKPLVIAMNMNVTSASKAVTLRSILTGNAMYLKLSTVPGVPGYLAGKWLKTPLTGLSPSSLFGSLQDELQSENPFSQFAAITAASHLHAAGTQVISGVTTTRYNGSFAPSAAVQALPAAQRTALGPYLKLIKGDVDVSVWIDSSNYVRKFQETDSTGDTTAVISCTYGSFNGPVKIAVPPSSQIYSPPPSTLND
jgi:hypothetical protein